MTFRRRLHIFRTFVAVMAIASGCVATAGWLVNRPETLRHALALANLRSNLKIEIASLRWSPLESKFVLEGVGAAHPDSGKSIRMGSLKLSYRILGLLRGRFVIDEIELTAVDIRMPKAVSPEMKPARKRLNLARLVLLKNLELGEAKIAGLNLAFGEDSAFAADELRLSLIPAFFGDTKLSIRVDGLLLSKASRQIISAGQLSLKASTDLSRWNENFPYINSVQGLLKLSDVDVEGLGIESFSASAGLTDSLMRFSELELVIGGNPLKGWLTADMSDKIFDLGIDMPKPITVPHFWRPLETMDLGGQLSGRVRLEGRGFVPSESNGQGHAELTHRFDTHPDRPVSVEADIGWSRGEIKVPKARILLGDISVAASGGLDLKKRNFKFDAAGKGFPLEDLFLEFTNPYLQRIFGPTNFSGTIEGWGKKFKATVNGTTLGGGWAPVTAERVETLFEATYDDLKLDGKIFSGDRQTGRAALKIRFGPKIGDADRSKYVELDAELTDHPAGDSLAAYGLIGNGNGRMKLEGPHTSFKSEVEARIERGSIYGLPFDLASSRIAITPRQMIFSEMALKLPSIEAANITGALSGDIGNGSIRLHGTPIEGLSIDVTYRGADSRWTLKEVSWSDPSRAGNKVAISGSVSTPGGMDLKALGRVDLGALAFAAPLMREGSGPVDVDLSVRGAADNPRLAGSLSFNDNGFSPRGARLALENVVGSLRFEGSRVRFDGVKAKIDDGEIKLGGTLDLRGLSPAHADMTIDGSSMRYRNEDSTLSLELDGSISVVGPFPSPLIKGDLTILDGKYAKDFTLFDAIGGGKKAEARSEQALPDFDPRLDLRARNSGDLAIRNNVGDIWLNMNIGIKGTRRKPVIAGSIETTEGEVHYLGMDFDITKGFIEFMERYQAPYLEVTAQKEVGVYNITLILHGPTDNLSLDLSATSPAGPLEKRDVISLLLFGVTEQERTALARQAGAGGMLTTQMAGQALSGVVGRPIQKAAGLDVFRLEASAPGATNVSRVYFGKKLTDRLSVNFATDINTTNAVQTVIGEYQITDNLLLTGQRSSDSNYRVTGSLRFRLR